MKPLKTVTATMPSGRVYKLNLYSDDKGFRIDFKRIDDNGDYSLMDNDDLEEMARIAEAMEDKHIN